MDFNNLYDSIALAHDTAAKLSGTRLHFSTKENSDKNWHRFQRRGKKNELTLQLSNSLKGHHETAFF